MSKVRGLNHVTLAVSDIDRSLAFYRDMLGLDLRAFWPEGAYLEAGTLWLCLSLDEAARREPHPDYTHLAFDVDTDAFAALVINLRDKAPIWKENRSEGDSLYVLDPDGHKIELHIGSLATRLEHYRKNPTPGRITI